MYFACINNINHINGVSIYERQLMCKSVFELDPLNKSTCTMVLSTEWSQVETIDLINDGNGLGFILVGGKSTGVVIKSLIPGGVAERDGRLQCGDHVLQIGTISLRGFSSEQVATVLRQTGPQVRIVVARPVEPTSSERTLGSIFYLFYILQSDWLINLNVTGFHPSNFSFDLFGCI